MDLEPLGPRRAIVALLGALAFAAALALLVLGMVFSPLPAVASGKPAPFGPPLAPHTVLVLVDGLRHDVAHDRARMPHLAERLERYGDAVLWASPVSMTSAAVLLMGTGVRGDLEQIIANESHEPTPFDSIFAALGEARAPIATIGDHVWPSLFPGVWTVDRTVVSHSLEVDEDDAVFADAREVLLAPDPPRFTVVHVNTPDKKAHAHGVTAYEYTTYIRGLDAKLEGFLASLPPTLSVVLTSDHGATDGGSHGSDTAVQRRSPFLAFGPALAVHPKRAELDQLDVAATLAALTGVRAPAQGRGHLATEVLDLDDARASRLACAQLRNVRAFARAVLGRDPPEEAAVADGCDAMTPAEALARSRAAARALDARIGHMRADSPRGFLPAGLAALALLGGARLLGAGSNARALARPVAAGAAAIAIALAVTWGFELLPGLWPDRARAAGYVLGNVPLLALLVRPRAILARVPARALDAALVMPGLLLLTEPKTTQAEAFATLAVLAIVVLFGRHRAEAPAPSEAFGRHWPALLGVAALAAPGVLDDSFVPRAIADRAWASHATAALCLFGYALWRQSHASLSRAEGLTLAALGALGLAVRDAAPLAPALALWGLGAAALPALAVHAARRRSPRGVPFAIPAAIVLVYALLSRDLEWPFLVGAMIVGAHLADELAADIAGAGARTDGGAAAARARAMLLTAVFAIAYVGRVGVQQGFHFLHMDWAAGAFHDPGVSTWRIGLGIGMKHALAIAAILGSAGLALPPAPRAALWRSLALAALARIVVLALMLHVCRNSFWTPVWVIGELPNMLLTLVCAVVLLAAEEARPTEEARA